MTSKSSRRRFEESDWVNSTLLDDISAPPVKTPKVDPFNHVTAAQATADGSDVQELDTIPAELMDIFQSIRL